jgi:rod shape-determining protein MreD
MLRAGLLHYGRLLVLLVLAVAVQSILSVRVPLLGVVPDIYILVVVLAAVGEGPLVGAAFGFVVGFVADIAFVEPLGIRTLIYLLAGYATGRFAEEAGLANAWMVVVVAGTVTLASQLIYATFMFLVEPGSGTLSIVPTQALPVALIDGLLAAPAYFGLMRLRLLPHPEAGQPSFR